MVRSSAMTLRGLNLATQVPVNEIRTRLDWKIRRVSVVFRLDRPRGPRKEF
jgi:hypothetical protein